MKNVIDNFSLLVCSRLVLALFLERSKRRLRCKFDGYFSIARMSAKLAVVFGNRWWAKFSKRKPRSHSIIPSFHVYGLKLDSIIYEWAMNVKLHGAVASRSHTHRQGHRLGLLFFKMSTRISAATNRWRKRTNIRSGESWTNEIAKTVSRARILLFFRFFPWQQRQWQGEP